MLDERNAGSDDLDALYTLYIYIYTYTHTYTYNYIYIHVYVYVYIYIDMISPVADFGSGSEYTEYALLKFILKRWLCGDPDKFSITYSTIYG